MRREIIYATLISFTILATTVFLFVHFAPKNGSTLQETIDSVEEGSVITISPGIYTERIIVNKSVSLVGVNRETTIIDANGTGMPMWILADNVKISNLTIRNSCPSCYGIRGKDVSNCSVSNCIVKDNGRGIYFYRSKNVVLTGNNVFNNNQGISLVQCENATLKENSIENNVYNFDVSGNTVSHFTHNVDSSNNVEGKKVYYWVNQQDREIPPDAGYVGIVNSSNITVRDLTLNGNYQGLLLAGTEHSDVKNLTITGNFGGIYLIDSHDNKIRNCTITRHREFGLILAYNSKRNIVAGNVITYNHSPYFYSINNETGDGIRFEFQATENTVVNNTVSHNYRAVNMIFSSSNFIYNNSFANNTEQVSTRLGGGLSNIWDDGQRGNYWSDYEGEDMDSNGIGDTAYIIDEANRDRYPLMNPPF